MSATEVFRLLIASDLWVDSRLSGRACVFTAYLPFIVTLLGGTALFKYRAAVTFATPGTLSAVVSVLIALVCFLLLHVWLDDLRSVFSGTRLPQIILNVKVMFTRRKFELSTT